MWMFQEEMEDVLCFHYGLSATDARACLASCRPDLLREFLELHLIDTQEYVVKEKLSTCSPEKFAPTKEVVDSLVSKWLDNRRSHPSQWFDPPWFPES